MQWSEFYDFYFINFCTVFYCGSYRLLHTAREVPMGMVAGFVCILLYVREPVFNPGSAIYYTDHLL